MVTGDQELQWAYLLCPTFELSNSEGKPLTNGYIELYIAGTRDKYYAASDFAGTLHPFQIPLDSLGSNIVLVSPDNAYDIYVYNRFGNLVMSRYNVVPTNGAAGGSSSGSNISINSEDGTVVVTESTDPETGVKTFDLSVPCVTGNPSYWTGRGAASMGVTISDTEYHKIDIDNHSINNNGNDIDVVNGEFNLKRGVYFWNVTVQLDKYEAHDNTRQRVFIKSGFNRGAYTMDMTHDETETISFSGITVANYDDTKQDIKIKSEGESPFKAVLYNVSIHKLNQNILGDNGTIYTAGDYIEITEDDVINVTGLTTPEDVEAMIDAAITALASGDMYTAGDYINIDNHVISVTGLQPEGDYLTQEDLEGYATETYVDNSVSSFTTHTEVYNATVTAIEVATGAIPEQLEAGDYIAIIDNKINVTGLQEAGDYATNAEVYEAIVTGIQTATGAIPDVSDFTTHTEVYESSVTSIQLVTGLIPDVSDLANRDEVYEAVVTGVQLATSMIPDQLEAGDYVSIVNNIINVTGLQPEGDYATNADVHEATVTAIEHVTALIPEAQVQSNWTETNTTDPSYIQNKPEEVRLVAGDNVTITETATSVVISASGGGPEYTAGSNIEINNDAISLKDEVHIDSRNNAPEGYLRLGNIVHWGHDDYGPGIMINATMDDYMDSRHYMWYNTSDQGREDRFWGQYDYDRNSMSVSGESYLGIYEGDIRYQRGDFDRTDRLPVIWSCSGMRYDIDRLQEAVTAIPAAQVQSDWTEVDTADPSYIQNKPTEKFLVGGDNVTITETATSVVISSQGGGSTYTAGDYISIENDEIAVTGVGNLVAGDNITITESGDNITISAADGGKTYTAGKYISIDSNDVIAVTGLAPVSGSDGIAVNNNVVSLDTPVEIVAGNNITISVTGASAIISAQGGGGGGGTSYTAGQYISIDANNEISVTGLQPAGNYATTSDISDMATKTWVGNQGYLTAVPSTYATDIEVSNAVVTGVQTATGWVNSKGYLTSIPSTYATDSEVSEAIASSITDFVTEGEVTALIPDSEEVQFEELDITQFAQASAIPTIELNSSNQVTAIDGHAIAGGGGGGGTSYTAGDYISIANDVISVTGVAPATAIPESEEVDFEELDITQFAQASAIPTFTEGNCIDITSNAISWQTTAGITDIVSVTALPANPVATVIYLIPET